MWHIDLIDIAGNGLVVGFKTNVDTLDEAEIIAANEIGKHFNTNAISLVYDNDMVYEVYCRNESIGCVHIKSL